jgi:hypothetical protein
MTFTSIQGKLGAFLKYGIRQLTGLAIEADDFEYNLNALIRIYRHIRELMMAVHAKTQSDVKINSLQALREAVSSQVESTCTIM